MSRLLSGLRWLFMPLGLFALVALGIHAGADAGSRGLLALCDLFDGWFDRAAASSLLALGDLLQLAPATVDRWSFEATVLVDLRERVLLARWTAVGLELLVDLVLAAPLLGYRELKEAAAPAFQRRLEQIRAVRGLTPSGSEGLRGVLRGALRDPTLLGLLLPPAVGAAALAGACRVGSEVQATLFGLLSPLLAAPLAGAAARFAAIFALGGVLASLGARAVLQTLLWGRRRALADRRDLGSGVRFRLQGLLRVGLAAPLAAAALLGAPLLSFFR